jgi:hypothetical protein
MPYYKFLVELPAMQRDNGLKTFGAFYVPAVKGEFLENMPLWDGGFSVALFQNFKYNKPNYEPPLQDFSNSCHTVA